MPGAQPNVEAVAAIDNRQESGYRWDTYSDAKPILLDPDPAGGLSSVEDVLSSAQRLGYRVLRTVVPPAYAGSYNAVIELALASEEGERFIYLARLSE